MNAKEYLSQARTLDMRIASKAEQIAALNSLADTCSLAFDGMPRARVAGASKVESTVMRIIELEDALRAEIDDLVDLKRRIMALIANVEDPEQQTLLEKRYLSFLPWERIATDMHYSVQHVYRIHGEALASAEAAMRVPERD